MTEGIEHEVQPINKEVSAGFRENDRIFEALEQIVNGFQGEYFVVGGIGVLGVLGKETRVTHDIDICVTTEQNEAMAEYLKTIGFEKQKNSNRRLLDSGTVLSRDGLLIDLVCGDLSEEGLTLRMSSGNLFIPKEGLGSTVSLRGIAFETFTPEVHYFLKNRAVSRNPFHTINPFVNRSQDEKDYRELKKIVDPGKAQYLIEKGFSYTGHHPGTDYLFR
ncbi:MAG: hypothetical protein ACD_61C00194G0004 [uncultured bacterium]|nr:MAG: hypothetical protein ACD_61C00194G0004 [uncultured bacterium]